MERQHIAYLLMAIMFVIGAVWAAFARHNTRDRKISRQRARENAAHEKRKTERP